MFPLNHGQAGSLSTIDRQRGTLTRDVLWEVHDEERHEIDWNGRRVCGQHYLPARDSGEVFRKTQRPWLGCHQHAASGYGSRPDGVLGEAGSSVAELSLRSPQRVSGRGGGFQRGVSGGGSGLSGG
jgi:hypothetical protein